MIVVKGNVNRPIIGRRTRLGCFVSLHAGQIQIGVLDGESESPWVIVK